MCNDQGCISQIASWSHLADLTQIPRTHRALSSSRTCLSQIHVCPDSHYQLPKNVFSAQIANLANLLRHQ